MDLGDPKQLSESTRSEITRFKDQLETEVCTFVCTLQAHYYCVLIHCAPSNAYLWFSKVQDMQSALKKQEKIWKTRMQKLGASYLEQLKDVRTLRNIHYNSSGYTQVFCYCLHMKVYGKIAVPGAKCKGLCFTKRS